MTPKEQYEARKAIRKARRNPGEPGNEDVDDTLDYLDRIATALERIAAAAETHVNGL